MIDERIEELKLPTALSERIRAIAVETDLPMDQAMIALLWRGVDAYKEDGDLDDPRLEYHLTNEEIRVLKGRSAEDLVNSDEATTPDT